MKLIIFEMRKIILRKSTILIGLCIIIIGILSGTFEGINWNNKVGSIREYNKQVSKYEGGNIDETLLEKPLEFNNKKLEVTFKNEYDIAIEFKDMWTDDLKYNRNKKYTLKYLKILKEQLKQEGKEDTYEYKDVIKNLSMMEKIQEPKYYNINGWNSVYTFVTSTKGVVLILFVIILSICPIFSEESARGMEKIIFTTKMGYRKIVSAKIIASIICVVLYVTLFYLTSIFIRLFIYGDFGNANILINNVKPYVMSIYKFSILQSIIISYFMSILSASVLALTICLVSAYQKNTIVSLIISVIICFIPLFIGSNTGVSKIFLLFPSLGMCINEVFSKYLSFNIFGSSVLYPIILIIALCVVFIMDLFLIYKVYLKRVME